LNIQQDKSGLSKKSNIFKNELHFKKLDLFLVNLVKKFSKSVNPVKSSKDFASQPNFRGRCM
jgi:hypothetical protein